MRAAEFIVQRLLQEEGPFAMVFGPGFPQGYRARGRNEEELFLDLQRRLGGARIANRPDQLFGWMRQGITTLLGRQNGIVSVYGQRLRLDPAVAQNLGLAAATPVEWVYPQAGGRLGAAQTTAGQVLGLDTVVPQTVVRPRT
jgi:hypothetical protein